MQTSQCTRTMFGSSLHRCIKCGRNQRSQSSMRWMVVRATTHCRRKSSSNWNLNKVTNTRSARASIRICSLFHFARICENRTRQQTNLWYQPFAFLISDTRPVFRMNKNSRRQLVHREHVFNRHVVRDNLTYWRCSQFSVCRCPARIKTKFDTVMTVLNVEHNHDVVRAPRAYGALKKMKREMQLKLGGESNKNAKSKTENH